MFLTLIISKTFMTAKLKRIFLQKNYDVFIIFISVSNLLLYKYYEGDQRSNANTSVISSTFGISKNGLHGCCEILSIL